MSGRSSHFPAEARLALFTSESRLQQLIAQTGRQWPDDLQECISLPRLSVPEVAAAVATLDIDARATQLKSSQDDWFREVRQHTERFPAQFRLLSLAGRAFQTAQQLDWWLDQGVFPVVGNPPERLALQLRHTAFMAISGCVRLGVILTHFQTEWRAAESDGRLNELKMLAMEDVPIHMERFRGDPLTVAFQYGMDARNRFLEGCSPIGWLLPGQSLSEEEQKDIGRLKFANARVGPFGLQRIQLVAACRGLFYLAMGRLSRVGVPTFGEQGEFTAHLERLHLRAERASGIRIPVVNGEYRPETRATQQVEGERRAPLGTTGVWGRFIALPTMRDLATEVGVSDDTFRRVRAAAGIEVRLKGAAARNRRYTPSEVDRLIAAAIGGSFLERRAMAEKWAKWGSSYAAETPQAIK